MFNLLMTRLLISLNVLCPNEKKEGASGGEKTFSPQKLNLSAFFVFTLPMYHLMYKIPLDSISQNFLTFGTRSVANASGIGNFRACVRARATCARMHVRKTKILRRVATQADELAKKTSGLMCLSFIVAHSLNSLIPQDSSLIKFRTLNAMRQHCFEWSKFREASPCQSDSNFRVIRRYAQQMVKKSESIEKGSGKTFVFPDTFLLYYS